MSAPIFLSTDEFLEILLAELPAGVFPTDYANDVDPSKRSVSSAELRAAASTLAGLSDNLMSITADKFISSATADGLTGYEKDYFATAQDSTVGLEARRQNVISKVRSTGGISYPAIKSVIDGILSPLEYDLLPYSGQGANGAWILGLSRLGVSTWLGGLDVLRGTINDQAHKPLNCSLDYAAQGLTSDQLAAIQRTAYTYEVRIYGTASDAQLKLLDMRLTELEPARSQHIIRNNQTFGPSDFAAYEAATPEYQRFRI